MLAYGGLFCPERRFRPLQLFIRFQQRLMSREGLQIAVDSLKAIERGFAAQRSAGGCGPPAGRAIPQRQRQRWRTGRALACAERQRLRQPPAQLDAALQGGGHQVPGVLPGLVSHAGSRARICPGARVSAGFGYQGLS